MPPGVANTAGQRDKLEAVPGRQGQDFHLHNKPMKMAGGSKSGMVA
jgi:hypothetical protein